MFDFPSFTDLNFSKIICFRYEHLFDIKTPGRVYYLAADTAEEMSRWVSLVCSACGLRQASSSSAAAEKEREAAAAAAEAGFTSLALNRSDAATTALGPHSSTVLAPSGTAAAGGAPPPSKVPPPSSSPYIHISTCYTGGRPGAKGGPPQSPSVVAASCNEERRVGQYL